LSRRSARSRSMFNLHSPCHSRTGLFSSPSSPATHFLPGFLWPCWTVHDLSLPQTSLPLPSIG
jgi:hypothetical protein